MNEKLVQIREYRLIQEDSAKWKEKAREKEREKEREKKLC